MLGIVRIYSRITKYLLDDLSETILNIKMAFRPGQVDLPFEQATANFNTITMGDVITEFDILLPEGIIDLK